MTSQEFQMQINRLAGTFGKNNYSPERVRIIWQRVGDFSPQWLERIVDEFISSLRQAPLPADFDEAIAIERDRRWKSQKDEPLQEWGGRYFCTYCKDTGVYVCTHPTKGGFWGFRCHCEKGLNDPRTGIPHYKQGHMDEGFQFADMPVYGKKSI